MMSSLLILLGVSLLCAVYTDICVTTLTVGGGGPLTSRLSRWVWLIALRMHPRFHHHRLLVIAGWVILIGIAFLWFSLTWFAWVLIFSGADASIVNAQTHQPATLGEKIYFAAYVLSTLGLGDFQPSSLPWQLATAIASNNGFFLLSLSIAYLLPVVSAATTKRSLAIYISCLGGTPEEILIRAWNGRDFGQLEQHLIDLTPMITVLGEKHLTYPVLHYFHAAKRYQSFTQSLTALDEALTLLQYGVKASHQLEPSVVGPVRRAIAAFLFTIKSAYIEPASTDPPPPRLESLRAANIPTVSDYEFQQTVHALVQRRRLLLALLYSDGWSWDAIASAVTTNRADHLDDQFALNRSLVSSGNPHDRSENGA